MSRTKLTCKRPTWIKRQPEQQNNLPANAKAEVRKVGASFLADEILIDAAGHAKVLLPSITTVNGQAWEDAYIYMPHWDGVDKAIAKAIEMPTPHSPAQISEVYHDKVLYLVQNDNRRSDIQGHGSVQCGLTSAAMCLSVLKPWSWVVQKVKDFGQLENYIAAVMDQKGWRSTSGEDLAKLFGHLGIKAQMRRNGTVGDLKQQLSRFPTVLGLAYKVSGHFVTATGYDLATGVVYINDPYGKRIYVGSANQWAAICHHQDDTYGYKNQLTPEQLKLVWTDLGDDKGWYIWIDPSTPYYGGSDFPTNSPGIPANFAKARLTPADIAEVAKEIGIEPAALQAVIEVEVGKDAKGFLPDGRPKILFEAQWFGYHTNDRYTKTHPKISLLKWDKNQYGNSTQEWQRFNQAAALDREAACMSCSWGIGQVMGFHWQRLGYRSAIEFATKMHESEKEQLYAMAKFLQTDTNLVRALKTQDWEAFARGYNGEGYKANQYDTKLAEAYKNYA